MKKFKLNLDELKVESFETKSEKEVKGTINGNAPCTEAFSGCQPSEPFLSCGYTVCVATNEEINCP